MLFHRRGCQEVVIVMTLVKKSKSTADSRPLSSTLRPALPSTTLSGHSWVSGMTILGINVSLFH